MTSSTPPQGPSGPPERPPAGYPTYAPPERRSVSFYVAVFLALLLFVSGALNVVLLVVSALGSAAGSLGAGAVEDDSSRYELVAAGGDMDAKESILRVPIEGAISENSSPLIGARGGTVSLVRRSLRVAARDDSIRAVLFDINSPGGGVTDSDKIWRMITTFKEDHPRIKVMALMGDVAASGGYYIASACDLIMARPTTITGSIGVIISSYNYGEALEKIGIHPVTIVSKDTPYKDMMSPTRPMKPEEEAKIRAIVQEMYERFVDIVDRGRKLDREQVRKIATGEIYSAKKALAIGLVDEIGSLEEAHSRLVSMTGVSRLRIVEQRRIPNLLDVLFRSEESGASLDSAVAQLLSSSTGPRFMYYWPGGR